MKISAPAVSVNFRCCNMLCNSGFVSERKTLLQEIYSTRRTFLYVALTLRWPERGGVGCVDAAPNRFFQFFSAMGRAFISNKILAVVSSLGHLSIKKFFRSDQPSWL